MDAIEALITRQSATKLAEPAPPSHIVDVALEAAMQAPDHGRMRPWRFILISGDARDRFGASLAECLRQRDPSAPEWALKKEREKPLRAPLVIVVAARVQPDHPKIPEIEQILAAGAAAQNIMLALHASGFGCMWKTGAPAYDQGVKAVLGLESSDHIVGFLYTGTIVLRPPQTKSLNQSEFIRVWS